VRGEIDEQLLPILSYHHHHYYYYYYYYYHHTPVTATFPKTITTAMVTNIPLNTPKCSANMPITTAIEANPI